MVLAPSSLAPFRSTPNQFPLLSSSVSKVWRIILAHIQCSSGPETGQGPAEQLSRALDRAGITGQLSTVRPGQSKCRTVLLELDGGSFSQKHVSLGQGAPSAGEGGGRLKTPWRSEGLGGIGRDWRTCRKYHLSMMADMKVLGQLLGHFGSQNLGSDKSHVDVHSCCALL